jgi:hypothetical protein
MGGRHVKTAGTYGSGRATGVLAACLLVFVIAARSASAAGAVSVRLVEGHNQGSGLSKGLEDISGTLRKNLPFKRFDLLDSRTVTLPADRTTTMARGFSIRCSGTMGALQVTLKRGSSTLMNTTLHLRRGRPFVMGGFTSDKGKLLVVLVAR